MINDMLFHGDGTVLSVLERCVSQNAKRYTSALLRWVQGLAAHDTGPAGHRAGAGVAVVKRLPPPTAPE